MVCAFHPEADNNRRDGYNPLTDMTETTAPKRTEIIRVRVTEQEREFLTKLAETSDRSVSSLIRIAIHNYYIKGAS